MAFRQLIDDLHENLEQRGWTDVKRSYGFVLLAVRDAKHDTITASDIATLLGVTKQAASKLVEGMVESDYLQRAVNDDDARRRPLTLTKRGHKLLHVVELIYGELEHSWAVDIGEAAVARLRSDLTTVLLARNNNALPPVRPTW